MKQHPHKRNLLLSIILALLVAVSFSGCRFYDDALRELKDAEYDVFILAKLLFMDATPPMVTSIIPDKEASGVARNMTVSAIFSEDIDPETVTPENFVITRGGAAVDGTLRCVRNSVIFKPISNFEANTPYDIIVHTGLKDRAGNALEEQFSWYFTTGTLEDTTAPTVTLASPADQTSGAPVNTGINVIFSESVDPSTVTADTFVVTRGDKTVTGQLSCIKNSVTFRPSSELAPNATFHVKITTGVADLAGNDMTTQYTWDFATAAAGDITPPRVETTVPNDKAVDADTDPWINVVFSETVDPSTVTTANLYVTRDGNPVSGIVSCSNNTAVFRPKAHLDAGASYRVTVTTRVTDMAGNRMSSPHVFTFTTGTGPDTTAPRVIGKSPGDNTFRVSGTTLVTAQFNEPVDPATVNEATFCICGNNGFSCIPIIGSVGLNVSNTIATFTPSADLPMNMTYNVTIKASVRDRTGNPMIDDCRWVFTTNDVPHHKAAGLSFRDIDMDQGQIQGAVTVQKADNESDIAGYRLYWGSNETTKIGSVLAEYPKEQQGKTYTFSQDTVPPEGGKYLLVYTMNQTGEMLTPLAIRAWDEWTSDLQNDFLISTSSKNSQSKPRLLINDDHAFIVWHSKDSDIDSNIRGRIIDISTGIGLDNDFLISTTNENSTQWYPQVACENNNALVVWQSGYGSDFNIRGRIIDITTGSGMDADFLISTTYLNSQINPVLSISNNRALIVWQSNENGSNYIIRGRIIDVASGPGEDNDFPISTTNENKQFTPQVVTTDNRALVVWSSLVSENNFDIKGRIIDMTSGAGIGGEFPVSTTNENIQMGPQISIVENRAMVVWQSNENGSNYIIRGRIIDVTSGPGEDSDFLVSTTNTNTQMCPQVSAMDNRAMIVWISAGDLENCEIRGRIIDVTSGPSEDNDFIINTTNTSFQFGPQISISNNRAIVVWQSSVYDANIDIRGRIIEMTSGAGVGNEFLVNTTNADPQAYPEVAFKDNNAMVVWVSNDNGSNPDIRGNILRIHMH